MKLYKKTKALLRRFEPFLFLFINYKKLRRKKNRDALREIIADVAHKQSKSKAFVAIDLFMKCLVSCGIYWEYTYYLFYKKSLREASRFFTYGRLGKIMPSLKTEESAALFSHKPSFNQVFAHYLKRDVFTITPQTAPDDLAPFLDRHPVFIAKPPSSYAGRGVWLVSSGKYTSREHLYEILMDRGTTLLEERVQNHPVLERFSKSSLNTLRIITLRLPEGVTLLAAFLKFNTVGGITDTLGHGGYACPVDLETGLIIKGMTDMNQEPEYKEYHPDGFYLPGIRIPYWEEAVAMAKEATLLLDDVYFVPWDIAVTENGPLIIEGNNTPSFNFQIMMDRPCNRDMRRAYRYARKNEKAKAASK